MRILNRCATRLSLVSVWLAGTCRPLLRGHGLALSGGASLTPGSRLEGTARRRNLGGVIAEPGLYDPAKERALENIFLKK